MVQKKKKTVGLSTQCPAVTQITHRLTRGAVRISSHTEGRQSVRQFRWGRPKILQTCVFCNLGQRSTLRVRLTTDLPLSTFVQLILSSNLNKIEVLEETSAFEGEVSTKRRCESVCGSVFVCTWLLNKALCFKSSYNWQLKWNEKWTVTGVNGITFRFKGVVKVRHPLHLDFGSWKYWSCVGQKAFIRNIEGGWGRNNSLKCITSARCYRYFTFQSWRLRTRNTSSYLYAYG